MTDPLRFTVFGLPTPKGSYSVHNGRLLEQGATKLRRWEKAVASSAQAAAWGKTWPLFVGRPLYVELVFVLPKPKKYAFTDYAHYAQGDIDKLERATYDAMQGVVFDNDTRIVDHRIRKAYRADGMTEGCTGAVVMVTALDAQAEMEG